VNDDDQQEMPPPVSGRGQYFGEGMLSGGEVSPGLQQLAARYKAQTPTAYQPGGTSNGMSAGQYKATLGGKFPVQNGSATDTYETMKFFDPNS
jgi:hypothetical protein